MVIVTYRKSARMKQEISRINPNLVSKSAELLDQIIKIASLIFIPTLIGLSIYLLFFKMVSGPPFGF